MGSAHFSQEQVQPALESSSEEQIQLVFEFASLDSKPISMSDNPFALSVFSKEVLQKIANFASIELIRNLMLTCKDLRNHLHTWFLQALASEKNPDRATSRFIANAIGNDSDTCLWLNAKFFLENHTIPNGLSIHLLTNVTAKKIFSHEVCSMIIQVSGLSEPSDSYLNIRKSLELLFSKVSFTNLKCLMLYGFRPLHDFPQWLKKLNLKVFHMGKFSFETDPGCNHFSCDFDTLERLYVVNYDCNEQIHIARALKELVVYCPESDRSIRKRKGGEGLKICLKGSSAVEEV
jgi:hypothetical protein